VKGQDVHRRHEGRKHIKKERFRHGRLGRGATGKACASDRIGEANYRWEKGRICLEKMDGSSEPLGGAKKKKLNNGETPPNLRRGKGAQKRW